MGRYSKRLQRIADSDPRIEEYEFDAGNDCGEHWLHLKHPWVTHDGGSVHERTVAECLDGMSAIHKPEDSEHNQ